MCTEKSLSSHIGIHVDSFNFKIPGFSCFLWDSQMPEFCVTDCDKMVIFVRSKGLEYSRLKKAMILNGMASFSCTWRGTVRLIRCVCAGRERALKALLVLWGSKEGNLVELNSFRVKMKYLFQLQVLFYSIYGWEIPVILAQWLHICFIWRR